MQRVRGERGDFFASADDLTKDAEIFADEAATVFISWRAVPKARLGFTGGFEARARLAESCGVGSVFSSSHCA